MHILLVEDEAGLSAAICKSLKNAGFAVTPVYDGERGLSEAVSGIYDAVILDVMLPKRDGFSVLSEMRSNKITTPVLLLTARSSLEDRLRGLDSGANYYLTKPFETQELISCLHVITRKPGETAEDVPTFGDLTLHPGSGSISCSTTGKSVQIRQKEMQLLELLMNNPTQILDKEFLIERIWGFENDSEYNNIEVYVSFVRKKLAFLGSNVTIRAKRGFGYFLAEDANGDARHSPKEGTNS